jgi:hypothetical protein
MVLSKSGGDGPHHFEKWWGRDPTVRYAYVDNHEIMIIFKYSQALIGNTKDKSKAMKHFYD